VCLEILVQIAEGAPGRIRFVSSAPQPSTNDLRMPIQRFAAKRFWVSSDGGRRVLRPSSNASWKVNCTVTGRFKRPSCSAIISLCRLSKTFLAASRARMQFTFGDAYRARLPRVRAAEAGKDQLCNSGQLHGSNRRDVSQLLLNQKGRKGGHSAVSQM
jgi:hypothetical protein